MNVVEALLPELRSRWSPDDGLLHHRLVIGLVFNCGDAARVNAECKKKVQRLRELKVDLGDGQEYVGLHERPYRFVAINRIVSDRCLPLSARP